MKIELEANKENIEKGNDAEREFKEWLDKHHIPYWYIQQDIDTFSPSLKEYFGSKRPDFMILLPNLGFFFVDVKNKILDRKYRNFPLDVKETTSYSY